MIISSSLMIAKEFTRQKELRLDFLKSSIHFFSFAKKMVVMYKMSVLDVYRSYCENNTGQFVSLLQTLLEEGYEKMSDSFETENEIREEKSILREFFLTFGKNETELQIEQLEIIKDQMNEIYIAETEKYRNTKGITYKITLLLGIGLSIIMW